MKSTLLLFVLALFTACAPPREPHPHVVIISIDSIVRDRLGYYGHTPQYAPELEVSPHLDSFATQSAVFDNAWSTTSWTLPAHAALLTGLSDRNHGVEADHFALDPLRTTLGEQFKSAGYTTAGFFTGPYLDPKYGFAKGFDIWDSAMMSPEELARHLDDWMERRARAGMPEPSQEEIRGIRDRVSHWDITSPRVNKGAMDFIEEHKEGDPFLLMLHYFDAHYDYLPDSLEKGLGQRFDPGYVGNMRGENWYFNPAVRAQEPPFERRISERDLGHILALYDAEIHWVDRHIGAVLKSLKDNGLWENTIVAIVADHGDEFFEHGMLGHRSTLFPELTSIPLLIRIPGQFEDGQRIQGLARIFDVGPTLLDYAGLPPLKE
ncbi:MAG: sulfatase, partial [Planctomycetes bacterium]|nr:sulfatase [Planctomycetota bacterium]